LPIRTAYVYSYLFIWHGLVKNHLLNKLMNKNAEQIKYWNGSAGAGWVETYPAIDRLLEPLSSVALNHVNLQDGHNVIDIGCGCGSTSLKLAEGGARVRGVDLSAPMIAEANRRALAIPNVQFSVADASVEAYLPHNELVFSRFGVMFFADPITAFANIRTALAPNGELVFLCWQSQMVNPWIAIPGEIVQGLLPEATPIDPTAPGPFLLADKVRLCEVLGAAGFNDISVVSVEKALTVGADLAEAMAFHSRIGPLSRFIAEQHGEAREQAIAAVSDALSPFVSDNGVQMKGAAWLVTATV
jgi:SAM-dependent methyltransferase